MSEESQIELKTTPLEDWFVQELIEQGFKQVDNTYVKTTVENGIPIRITMRHTDGAWRRTIDVLVGVKVIDELEGLL